MDANTDYDDDAFDEREEAEIEDEEPRRSSPLRIILLILLVLVLLCVVCWLGSSFLGGAGSSLSSTILDPIQGLLPGGGAAVVPADTPAPAMTEEVPTQEPVAPAPTDESALPTEEPTATPVTGEQPATVEPTMEPTQEPGAPTEEPAPAPTEEATTEPTTTTEPVPGPTNTPTRESGPIVITPSNCEENDPPVANANGPYDGMMGKGQALVTFDAGGSEDPDGMIIDFVWDFGDGSEAGYGPLVTHGYTEPGQYTVTLTVIDNCDAIGQDTAEVTVSGATPPPGTGTPGATATATATAEPPPDDVTLGFCYIVNYGDTLSGIAWYYGIPLQDLAYVNNVPADYFVKLGEGLFIPYGPITEGANGYQVQYGDTIYSVAYQCAVAPAAVAEANDISVDTALTPGEVIIIPIGRY